MIVGRGARDYRIIVAFRLGISGTGVQARTARSFGTSAFKGFDALENRIPTNSGLASQGDALTITDTDKTR